MPCEAHQRFALARPRLGPVRLESGRLLGVGQGGVIVARFTCAADRFASSFERSSVCAVPWQRSKPRVYCSTASSKFFSLNASFPNSFASGRRSQFSILLWLRAAFFFAFAWAHSPALLAIRESAPPETSAATDSSVAAHCWLARAHAAETSAAVAQLSGAARALLCRHDHDLWARVV